MGNAKITKIAWKNIVALEYFWNILLHYDILQNLFVRRLCFLFSANNMELIFNSIIVDVLLVSDSVSEGS